MRTLCDRRPRQRGCHRCLLVCCWCARPTVRAPLGAQTPAVHGPCTMLPEIGRGITTWAIAITLFTRFYARKSMKKNNTFVSGSTERVADVPLCLGTFP